MSRICQPKFMNTNFVKIGFFNTLRWQACCLAIVLIPLTVVGRGVYADADLNQTALTIAPQDAAFFSTSVNMRAAWNDLAESKFITRLRAVPFIQQLEDEFNRQWENPQGQLAQAKGVIESPNVQNLIKLCNDMFDEEVFVYGGSDWCEALDGFASLQNEITSRMSGGPEAMQAYFQGLEKSDVDRLRIPTTIMGFRLSGPDAARIQLDALEGILRFGGGQIPEAAPFLQRLKRTDFQDGQTLSLTLDASLIPLDAITDEEGRRVAEKLTELLDGRGLTFGIGIKGSLMLLAIGENEKVVEDVGMSDLKLIDHEVLSVLQEAAPSNLRSIGYVSANLQESNWNANLGHYFERIVAQFSSAISSQAERMPDLTAWQQELQEDAAWMDQQMMKLKPEFGPTLGWSRAIEDGSEGISYNWTQSALQNGTPLMVTSHAGTDPLLMLALKQKDIPYLHDLAEKLLDAAPGHLKRFISLAEDDEEERERVLKIVDQVWPIVKDGYAICRDKIGPSLSVNETLFTMSAGWTTSFLGPNLPPPERALPLPEFAGVCGLSDRELFINGCDELYKLADRVVDLIRENQPESIPVNYSVPRPEEDILGGGTKYYYSEFSAAVPIEGFEPQLFVSDDVIVFGYSDRQVRDLMDAKPLEVGPAWLTPETPTAVVSYVDFAGIFSAFRPWVAYGLSLTGKALDEPLSPAPGPIPTGGDVLQIWDCFRSAGIAAGTATINDAGATVTRWVWVGE